MRIHTYVFGIDIFREVREAFRLSAAKVGHEVVHVEGMVPTTEGINLYFVGQGGFLRDPDFSFPRHSVNVLYNFEQRLPSGYDRFDAVLNIFPHLRGGRLIDCPLGHSPAFETHLDDRKETVDVLHLGCLREGEKGVFGQKQGHLVTIADQVYGDTRDQMILGARINLIVKALPTYHFPILRFLLMACKRKFVLTEAHDSYPSIDPARHLTIIGDFPEEVRRWLQAGQQARQEVANRVYEDLRSRCPYDPSVAAALEQLTEAVC